MGGGADSATAAAALILLLAVWHPQLSLLAQPPQQKQQKKQGAGKAPPRGGGGKRGGAAAGPPPPQQQQRVYAGADDFIRMHFLPAPALSSAVGREQGKEVQAILQRLHDRNVGHALEVGRHRAGRPSACTSHSLPHHLSKRTQGWTLTDLPLPVLPPESRPSCCSGRWWCLPTARPRCCG